MGISICRSICRSQCGPVIKEDCEVTSAVSRKSCCHVVVATGLMDSTRCVSFSVCAADSEVGRKAENHVVITTAIISGDFL